MALRLVHSTGTGSSVIEQDDAELVARVARQDLAAFEQLYGRYYKRVFGFAARITRRLDTAEEVVSDTMLVVWRKADGFAGRSKPSSWIFGIAYRKALKAARPRRETQVEDLESLPDQRQSDGLERIWLRAQLARALGQLPAEQRAVVELTYMQGHSYDEIAEIVGCPPGTVKTRMRSARAKLRAILSERPEDPREVRRGTD